MSIVSVTLTVPVSGDGPIADISALVGPKTVQLTGTFEGYYDLLVSHNGVNFTAAVAFDASGPEGLKQTIPGAFNYVRLRANAQSPSGVTCSVTGVSAVGENGFGTIATLAAGFSGLTPIIDTSAFIAPTGSEADTNFICQGDFQGPIVVLGSADGVLFNPIGEFRVDRRPEGAPPIVALTPLVTEAKVRYVRLSVTAVVQGAVVVTMGGRVPAAGGGGTGTPMDVFVSKSTGVVYQALGEIATSTLGQYAIVVGNQNTIDPTGNQLLAVVGALNVVSHDSVRSNIFGHSNLIQNQGSNTSLVGNNNTVTNTATGPTFVGGDANITSCRYGVLVGNNNLIGLGNDHIYVIGSANTLNDFTSGSIVVGHDNQIQANSANSAIFGNANTVNEVSNGPVVVLGYNNNMGSQRGVIVGHSNSTYPSLSVNFIVGYDCHIYGSASHNILCGDAITTSGGDDNILAGRSITLDDNTHNNFVAGPSLTLNAGAVRNLVLCPSGATLDLASSNDNVFLGGLHTVGNQIQHVVAVGDTISVPDSLEQCVLVGNNLPAQNSYMIEIGGGLTIGTNTGASIVLGFNSGLGNDSNSCVLIHNGAIGINSSQSISIRAAVGDNSDNCISIGGSSIGTVGGGGSSSNIAFGSSVMADHVSNSIALGGVNGSSNSIEENTDRSCIVGQGNTIGSGAAYVQLMGDSIGANAAFSTNFERLVLVGSTIAVSNSNLGSDECSSVVALGDKLTLVATQDGSVGVAGKNLSEVIAIGHEIKGVCRFNGSDFGSKIVLIGSDLLSGLSDGSGVGTSNNIIVGSQCTSYDDTRFNLIVGNSVTLQPVSERNVIIATFGGSTYGGNRNVAIGASPRINNGNNDVVCIGSNSDTTLVSVGDGCSGAINIGGTINDNSRASVALGHEATVSTTSNTIAIAIGMYAVATNRQCVIGSTAIPAHDGSINDLIVRGSLDSDGSAINTLQALANPAASGECGLVVTYNDGATIANKTLKAAVSPPVGSLLVYLEP
jgi:hypothetical protein